LLEQGLETVFTEPQHLSQFAV